MHMVAFTNLNIAEHNMYTTIGMAVARGGGFGLGGPPWETNFYV